MAEYKHQQQDFRQGQQHLANRNQEASAHPVVIIHQRQVALAEAGLEAHLQHQQQVFPQRRVGGQHQ